MVHSGVSHGIPFEIKARASHAVDHHADFAIFPRPGAAPLLRRAWCFQERILSARVLHFHGQGMIWGCESGSVCECGLYKISAAADPAAKDSTAAALSTLEDATTTGWTMFRDMRLKQQPTHISQGSSIFRTEMFRVWRGVIINYSPLSLTR
ncbi:hypothetical protein B0T25DRAFT_458980 [Lasiosphaeria hispida]|uniref:Uncharacterized protein n=1 Tax=Lasiosphaeria hispida TaxID=260671 RepID=A0AAJ0HF44_9PEZI|nr:hypothetical protein B0T25DRAFT_458980 [Lasiosphaeria hispida]